MTGESREGDVGHGLRWKPRKRKPKPPAPKPVMLNPPAAKTCDPVFHGKGVWVGDLAGFPPDYALGLIEDVDWIAVKVAHGLERIDFTTEQRGWLNTYFDAGLRLLSWSWITADDANQQGRFHATVSFVAGHWANGEKVLAYTGADGKPDPAAFNRSKDWIAGFRSVQPTKPLGVSPEPRQDFDHEAWLNEGAALGNQCYTAENGATIPASVAYYNAHGWANGQIVPLIEPRFGGKETPAADYVRDAQALGLPGICLYPGDGLLDRPDIYDAVRSFK